MDILKYAIIVVFCMVIFPITVSAGVTPREIALSDIKDTQDRAMRSAFPDLPLHSPGKSNEQDIQQIPTLLYERLKCLLNTYFPTQEPQMTMYKGVEQSYANIQMIGNVYGLASNPCAGIDEIRFSISLAPGVTAIDLTKMKIIFSTPRTTPVILQWGSGTQDTTHFTTKLNGQGNSVVTMMAQQQIEVYFNVIPVPKDGLMTFEIQPAVGAPLQWKGQEIWTN